MTNEIGINITGASSLPLEAAQLRTAFRDELLNHIINVGCNLLFGSGKHADEEIRVKSRPGSGLIISDEKAENLKTAEKHKYLKKSYKNPCKPHTKALAYLLEDRCFAGELLSAVNVGIRNAGADGIMFEFVNKRVSVEKYKIIQRHIKTAVNTFLAAYFNEHPERLVGALDIYRKEKSKTPRKTRNAGRRSARSRVGEFGETVVRPKKKTVPRARKSAGGGAKGVDGPGREAAEGVRERLKTRVEKIRVKPVCW